MNISRILTCAAFLVLFQFPNLCVSQNSYPIYINEINYRAIQNQQNIDFVEIFNDGSQTVDLSGWFLTGGLQYTFPAGASISSNSYLVIAADPGTAQSVFGVSGFLGPWEGKLASSEDKVVLRTPNYEVIDRVDYDNWKEWPNVRYLDTDNTKTAVSIQKINPLLTSNQPGSWKAGIPTPKVQNNAVYESNLTAIPVIKDVSRSPDKPMSSAEVRIKADFAGFETYASGMTVTLQYQINNAGNYWAKSEMASASWIPIEMLDDGIGADSTANNGVYTALIPSSVQVDRRLIRYRIKVNANGSNRYFPDPNHRENNYSYFVYDGHDNFSSYNFADVDTINEFIVITNDDIPTFGESGTYPGEGTLIYNGKIYDHIQFRGRGSKPRPKQNLKFKFNSEKKLTLTDNCGKDYSETKSKISLSGGYVNDPGGHGFAEKVIYKILDLVGALPRIAEYTQLRFIDSATESGGNGDFWGLYLMLEDYNSEDYFEQHDLPTGNLWGHKPEEIKHLGDFPNAGLIGESNDTGPFDWDLVIRDRIANVIYGQNGINYYGKHSHIDYYNSETNLWHTWWSDMDNAFSNPEDDDNWFYRNTYEQNSDLENDLVPNNTIDYRNEMRSVYDLLLNSQQRNFLVESQFKPIYDASNSVNWTQLDDARWGNYVTSYHHGGSISTHMQWYKDWFTERANYIATRTNDGILDNNIPTKPTIFNIGSTALDNIKFSNSSFSDPNGNSFAALEWRVGEWSDPSNPYYDTKCDPKFEIETKWRSGEKPYTNNYQIPAAAGLKVGRTYKIRVRYKDSTGRWSHWSNAQTVVPTEASPVSSNLVINEIMYNPSERFTEFIEIHNTGNASVSLSDVKFSDGVDYNFPSGSSIQANQYLVIAEDSSEFFNIHGFYPFGEYKSSLSDKGEYIELQGPYRAILDSLTYNDSNGWPETADNGFYSLAFKEGQIDNAFAGNWGIQSTVQTPGQMNEFNDFGEHAYSGLVINEIHYNPFNGTDPATGDPVDGRKFQFVELKNISSTSIALEGVYFSDGIDYYFPDNSFIGPGEFIVLAEDKSSFEDRYGFAPFDKFDGKLNEEGETLLLNRDFILLDALTYDNEAPWDTGADGGIVDYSLGLIDPEVDNDSRLNWKTQCTTLYTPGAENDFGCFNGLSYNGLTINEIHYNAAGGNIHEFLEITNHSNAFMNLEDVAVTGDMLLYVFDYIDLPPNQMIVLAKDFASFQTKYGFAPHDVYSGDFSSVGESLVLQDLFTDVIDEVTFGISAPWPIEPTLGDYSLALISGSMDNSLPESWCIQQTFVTPKATNVFDDSDNDNVLDCKDQCPGQSDSLIGTACEDGDPCTSGEAYNSTCDCVGGVFQDADNDGVCDAQDACPNIDDNIIGQSCSDGDDCTTGEIYDANCNCSGGVFQDADNDGVCDADDQCSNFDDGLIGQTCDDGNECTTGETYNSSCNCSGGIFQDADNDGVCDAQDQCAGVDDSIIGQACSDGDVCTTGEVYNSNCQCAGGSFQDSDGDGVCNALDQCPGADDALIGQTCEDGDVCTIGETYDSNCSCSGGVSQDSDNDTVCDALDNSCNLVDFEDFEMGQGIWSSNGIDALIIPPAENPFGSYSFVIQDNSGVTSSFSSSVLDLTGGAVPHVVFSFQSQALSTDEDFFLEISTDGGSSFQQLRQWKQGANLDFVNNVVYHEDVEIPSMLVSSTMVIRFRCDGSINADRVFIDDLKIDLCSDCDIVFTQTDNAPIDQSRFVQDHIESNGVIMNGSIEFTAEDYILMTEGFEVQLGAVYHAYINPCSN